MQGLTDLVELQYIRGTDIARWGSKSGALSELLRRGFPVPPGVCLSINAYRRHGMAPQLPAALEAALRRGAPPCSKPVPGGALIGVGGGFAGYELCRRLPQRDRRL